MLSILMAIVLGIGFTVFATQNSGSLIFNLFGNTLSFPTYIFAAICFLIGIIIATIFNLGDLMGAAFDLNKRTNELKNVSRTKDSLQTQVNNLNTANAQLKDELNRANAKLREERFNRTKQNVKNFFGRMRHTTV